MSSSQGLVRGVSAILVGALVFAASAGVVCLVPCELTTVAQTPVTVDSGHCGHSDSPGPAQHTLDGVTDCCGGEHTVKALPAKRASHGSKSWQLIPIFTGTPTHLPNAPSGETQVHASFAPWSRPPSTSAPLRI